MDLGHPEGDTQGVLQVVDLKNLCGNDALKNVLLVTTGWDLIDEEEGNSRETEFCDKHWNMVIELGCRTAPFYYGTQPAWDVVSQFQDTQCTLLLQKELVDQRLKLEDVCRQDTVSQTFGRREKNMRKIPIW